MEREVGNIQRFARRRGSHASSDLEREALAQQLSSAAAADFALDHASTETADERVIEGLLFDSTMLSQDDLQALFAELSATATTVGLSDHVWLREDGVMCVAAPSCRSRTLLELCGTPGIEHLCLCLGTSDRHCSWHG
jgi:hypothetical protein